MKQPYYITSYCHIKNGAIYFNDHLIYKNEQAFQIFIKGAYKHLEVNYPKFFKMDPLSKLAFIGAEVILEGKNKDSSLNQDIAILFSNRASSLDTDRGYQESISNKENYYPSPSVFVYTLPNICIGEICIKHKLLSENSFFIFESFNAEHLLVNAHSLLASEKAEKVLCGWVDFDNEDYEAFLYLVEKEGNIEHQTKEINRLYNLWKN